MCFSEDIWLKSTQSQSEFSSFIKGQDEDYYYDDYENEEYHQENIETTTMSTSKVKHKDHLPESVFSNYDDFYYYEDELEPNNNRVKRSPFMRGKIDGHNCKRGCCYCLKGWSTQAVNLTETEFRKYYKFFLQDNPNEICPKSGHAGYSDSVRVVERVSAPLDGDTVVDTEYKPDFPDLMVSASNFMVYHTILKTSKDYYEALRFARKLSKEIEDMINVNITKEEDKVKVFPYSVFYVFYEQYLTMWEDTLKSLGVSLLAIFVVTFFMLGLDLVSSIISLVVILMILVNLGGMMYWWNITLNAVSLVNLVMAVGISVEFSSHITRAFAVNVGENRVQRATDTLVTMGSSVSILEKIWIFLF